MRIYAAYQMEPESEHLVLVRQGFAFLALLFPVLWLAWRRMWWEASAYLALYLVLYLVLGQWEPSNSVSWFLLLASSLFLGFEGNSLYESSLRRRGYRLENVIIARDLMEAESRFFGMQTRTSAAISSE